MKSIVSALVLIAGLSLCSTALATEPFTPEQYKEIERLITAERGRIRVEVRQEIMAELVQGKITAEEIHREATTADELVPSNGTGLDVTAEPLKGDLGLATADQVFSTRGSGIELSAAAGDGDAAIVLERSESDTRNGRFVDTSWRLKTSAPIDDDDRGRANFGTLSGFADGLAVELSWTHASTRQVLLGGDVPSAEWEKLCSLSSQDLDGCTLAAIDAAAADSTAHDLRVAYDAFQRSHYGWGRLLSLKVGASRNRYRFLDATLDELSDTKVGWTIGGAMGFSTPKRNALYSMGFDLERAYVEQDKNVYCPSPFPAPCAIGRLGAPATDWNRLLWVEARTSVLRVPFSFRVTRELKDDVTGIDMPIYILRDADGVFTGGVRLGWTSEEGFDAGVFVGTGFDVFD
jgi:hypothetical protein